MIKQQMRKTINSYCHHPHNNTYLLNNPVIICHYTVFCLGGGLRGSTC
jgi:hypothetical protein